MLAAESLLPSGYVKYVSGQRAADPLDKESWKHTERGSYSPRRLIRVSDWKVVPGAEAKNGYCTLSYCWEQSGTKVQKDDGEYEILDESLHQVIVDKDGQLVTIATNYEGVLEQICKDFDINYLWYDKVCINQSDGKEKSFEVKQMHLVYSKARFTVALVPEIAIENASKFDQQSQFGYTEARNIAIEVASTNSKWWKRSWTLEELMMSRQILIVGSNTYVWCQGPTRQMDRSTQRTDFISLEMLDFKAKKWKSANEVLRHAHFRESSKELDKIYALANVFHGIVPITIDYSSNIQHVGSEFYRNLGERDLSVMCFGSVKNHCGDTLFATTMGTYNLPSWTGISGLHTTRPVIDVTLYQNIRYFIDCNMHLQVQCRGFTIQPVKYCDGDASRHPPAQESINPQFPISPADDLNGKRRLDLDQNCDRMLSSTGCYATHYWSPDGSPDKSFPLSLTEDCDECSILSILFDGISPETTENGHIYLLPVLKKVENTKANKAIGVILMDQFQWGGAVNNPQEFLDKVFSNCCGDKLKSYSIL